MRTSVRRAIVCTVFGVVATLAIAWTAALAITPAHRHAEATAAISRFGEEPSLGFSLSGERRWGIETYIVTVREARAFNSEGPAWEPFQGPQLGDPKWLMKPEHHAVILEAIASYPAPIGFPPYVGSAPRAAPWPFWLGGIPATQNGLVAFGGRAAGWPFPTVRSLLTAEPHAREGQWSGTVRVRPFAPYNRLAQSQDPQNGTLPLFPHPVLFPLSVLMWGGGLFALWTGVRAVVQGRRKARGLCAACGYDLRGSQGACPECGEGAAAA